MLAVLPLCCFGLLFSGLYLRSNTRDPRRPFLEAAIVWGLILTVITEVVSLFHALACVWISGAWGIACIGSALVFLRSHRPARELASSGRSPVPFSLLLLLGGAAAIVAAIGVTALLAPPNSYDAMTYHMSRVMHWMQDRTLAYYPTSIPKQLYFSPWAEYAVLHLQLLSGGDHLANLVAWFSMVGSIVGVSLLAQQLGAAPAGEMFAAVAAATIPMGILQGSSALNDSVVSFWLVCLAVYVLRLASGEDRASVPLAFGAGGSLGLALLTKGTAYIFALPLLLWLVVLLRRAPLRTGWKAAALIIGIALATNAGYYLRNLDLFGSPLGLDAVRKGDGVANDAHTVSGTLSNLIRNLSVHVATPDSNVNAGVERAVRSLVRFVGANPDDPRTSLAPFHVSASMLHESFAVNPSHFILILASIGLLVQSWTRKERLLRVWYGMVLVAAFLVFSVTLKWQPWGSRLELPLFVLAAPLVGLLLSVLSNHHPGRAVVALLALGYAVALMGTFLLFSVALGWHPWRYRAELALSLLIGALIATRARRIPGQAIAAVLIIAALPWVLCNTLRPLLGSNTIFAATRTSQYFRDDEDDNGPYKAAVRVISARKCAEVGLVFRVPARSDLTYEYPLWVLFLDAGVKTVRLEHLDVDNVSAVKSRISPFDRFHPCAVFLFEPSQSRRRDLSANGQTYVREWSQGPVSVFVRPSRGASFGSDEPPTGMISRGAAQGGVATRGNER